MQLGLDEGHSLGLWVGGFRVSRFRVRRLGVGRVRRFLVGGIFGLSFVFDLGDVSVLISLVGDDLSAAVWQDDAVRTIFGDSVADTLVRVVVIGRLILDGPVELEGHRHGLCTKY